MRKERSWPCSTHSSLKRYPGINLNKVMMDLYSENFKYLMKEDTKTQNISYAQELIELIWFDHLPICRFNAIPIKNYHDLLHRNRIETLKFKWTHRRPQTAKETLSKNEGCWRDHCPNLQLYYRAMVIQTACHWVRHVEEWVRQKHQWCECILITVAKECRPRTSSTVGGYIKRTQRPLHYIIYISI